MKIPVIAEAEKVQLQRFALHHFFAGYVGYRDRREIRLSGNGTKACKFRAVKFYKVIVVRVLVQKCFQYLRSIIIRIFYFFISEKGDPFFFQVFSAHIFFLSMVKRIFMIRSICQVPDPSLH